MSWVTEELEGVDLGDQRRNRQLVKIIEDLAGALSYLTLFVVNLTLGVGH